LWLYFPSIAHRVSEALFLHPVHANEAEDDSVSQEDGVRNFSRWELETKRVSPYFDDPCRLQVLAGCISPT
jgi:hypothetical protein